MIRQLLGILLAGALLAGVPAQAVPDGQPTRLLIAFASTRERRDPPYPKIYFYEHDGVGQGKLLGSIDSITKGTNNTSSDMHPSLSRDGRYCAFSTQIGILDGARIEIWDRAESRFLKPDGIQENPKIHQMGVSLSGDGKLVAYSAWARPGSTPRWGVFLYDRAGNKTLDPPRLNHDKADQRMPALSGDGRFLAYASNAPGGVGSTDVYLYDVVKQQVLPVPELNSPRLDFQPALSGDGRLVAFTSDRPGGAGGRDIYLFDRTAKRFVPLPGLNSTYHDQSPSLSQGGRYLAFVSEREGGAGERDVYLYDCQTQRLLPTPGLNSREDDFDPCAIELGPP